MNVFRIDSLRQRGWLCVALLMLAGCRFNESPIQLGPAFPTKEAAATAVADAVWQRDAQRLESLSLSEVEFHLLVWPRLPASRPEVGMPIDYLWRDTHIRSLGGLSQTLAEYGGRRLTVDAVTFKREPTHYGLFTIHAKTILQVRDEAGSVRRIRLFGSMIESPDGWKIYSYVVD